MIRLVKGEPLREETSSPPSETGCYFVLNPFAESEDETTKLYIPAGATQTGHLVLPWGTYIGEKTGSSSSSATATAATGAATDSEPWIQVASGVVKLTDEKDHVDHLAAFLLTDGNGRLAINVPHNLSDEGWLVGGSDLDSNFMFDYSNLLESINWRWNDGFKPDLSHVEKLEVSERSQSGCYLFRKKQLIGGGFDAEWLDDPWIQEDYLYVPAETWSRIGMLILKHKLYDGTSEKQYEKLISESEGNNWSVGCVPKVVLPQPTYIGDVSIDESNTPVPVWSDEFGRLSLHFGLIKPESVKRTKFTLNPAIVESVGTVTTFTYSHYFSSVLRPRASNLFEFDGLPSETNCRVVDKYDREAGKYIETELIMPDEVPFIGTVQIPTVRLASIKESDR